ncbi:MULTISPECIES: hypothetical protein [Myxococcus]|uniref:Uncharacterized protein n=1 Tax=Myxococcus llanfairpwllgwyngyllgogerychwyrndrobwllllantysiliogogogochensis TaxID=2590453 RepID=A0A540WQQ4_9BACT|nr:MULTISPECIES: hypothetical protein [Myxococcus]NTX00913.1 hypothetical protein [Myxococcus sp. CA040A]NTX33401.1 hypothetical protein [Myxococcus sp. CA033]TQF11342.1 hypothetical protein FJV41_34815 [Myxococcus llanfairpwllgwyngyllgogerychwyrndrobwllllantysiliogogogochensis]
MPDIDERQRGSEPLGDWRDRESGYEDEVPGHTPGVAEGDDDAAPHRAHPFPDPDKTPGCAEG